MKEYKIILASASPRRKELLQGLNLDFEVRTKHVEEDYPAHLSVTAIPEYLSQKKAKAFEDELTDDMVVISADTIVAVGDKVLGKPHGAEEARQMLSLLNNGKHLVVTGVTIMTKQRIVTFSVQTKVVFDYLTAGEIDYYVKNYSPFDKAGAYGIQEWIGYIGISAIEGSYYNVMGLPVQRLYKELRLMGIVSFEV